MKQHGFTLIELLAVIIILAIILAIAIPNITGVVNNAKKNAFEDNARLLIKAINNQKAYDETFNYTTLDKDKVTSILNVPNDNYKTVAVEQVNNKPSVTIVGQNKWQGLIATGTYDNIVISETTVPNDTTGPVIAFSTNGNDTYISSVNVMINITDDSDIDNSSLKYLWSTDSTTPGEDLFSLSFNNGDTISGPSNVTGEYYLWILAKDVLDNTTLIKSNLFRIDNNDPVITMMGSSPIAIDLGSTYTDAGATASDDHDGDITSNITNVSTVNPNATGSYTVTYNVSDSAGNAATPVVRTVNVLSDYIADEGVNRPKLVSGMTALKWNGSSWDTVSNPDVDTSWYNYTNKEWANARTSDGSYWVWIPRYVYRISSNWHANATGTIDVQFSMGTDDTRGGTVTLNTGTTASASNLTWTNQPAFTFGSTQLTGIWVAKFEATATEGVANGGNDGSCTLSTDNVTTKTVKIIPNATSWRCIDVGKMFTNSRSMETNSVYGWGTSGNGIDTHLMKNVEWGAVTYLSKSTYGQNTNEIWINPTYYYTTGCAGNSLTSASTTTCSNSYETTNGVKAGTTGNIYGIYDMVGGSEEIVAAYINNGHSNLNYGSSILSADSKYKEIYAVAATDAQANNYPLSINQKGDSVYEISSTGTDGSYAWFGDYTRMPSMNCPWFMRGGRFRYGSIGTLAGIFSFTDAYGSMTLQNGFRPVLAVKSGL